MKKLIAPAVSLILVYVPTIPWTYAQNVPQGFDVFAEFGPSCLSGPVHSGASGEAKCEAGRFFTGARLRLTKHDAVEGSYSYSPNVFSYTPFIFGEAYSLSYQNKRLSSHSFNYVRYLATNPHVQPFVTGGVGSEHFQGRGVYASSAFMTYSVSQFAWNYGAGIDLIPRRYFALRLECRDYITTFPFYRTITLHNIVPSVGIVFRFHRDRKL